MLLPVLLDFHLADGVVRSGPDGAWQVSERPELITDARRRPAGQGDGGLRASVRRQPGHPRLGRHERAGKRRRRRHPRHFGELQTFIYELTEAVHRAGNLATVGHRNAVDPLIYFRGRVASDLGQAHYYPGRHPPQSHPLRHPARQGLRPTARRLGRAAGPPRSHRRPARRRPARRPPPLSLLELARPPGSSATATPSNPTPPRSARPWPTWVADGVGCFGSAPVESDGDRALPRNARAGAGWDRRCWGRSRRNRGRWNWRGRNRRRGNRRRRRRRRGKHYRRRRWNRRRRRGGSRRGSLGRRRGRKNHRRSRRRDTPRG